MLTVIKIQSATSSKNSYYLWDQSGQRGTGRLGVKIFTSGKKQFVFRYYQQQKEKFISIGLFSGRAGGMTLAEAREQAQVFSQLLLSGRDPKLHIEQQEIEQKRIDAESKELGTLEDLFHSYTEQMKIDGKRTHETVLKSLKKECYPYIDKNIKACDVTTNDIKYVISKVIQRGAITSSNRVRSYIMAAFNHGMRFDNDPRYFSLECKFALKYNPVSLIPRQKDGERVGERFLEWRELRRFLKDLRENYEVVPVGQDLRHLLQLCIYLGGQRPYEVVTLEWWNVDWKERFVCITKERSKNKKDHIVPLNELAFEIFQKQYELSGGGRYVFPNPNDAEQPMKTSSICRAVTRYRDDVGFDKFVPRDLRRTCKTLMGSCRISKEIRDRIQNHALQDVSTRHYDRYDYFDDKLGGLESWNNKLKELIGYVPPALSVVSSAETLPFPDIKSTQSLRANLK
ncbi:site-specific integrase [Vibrio anguillarum]|uniref:Site-specific integrase n=14 Tax=Vibrio anguillarum TaxID=55601 RepID=A0AAW4AXU4_VIBAN|nr:site-specific integrase [Vibrio anguillarum]AEH34189.1 DNA integration/recombination/inversion protein [Vibrio anguillarum 775]AGU58522.1 integrase [Vibrio anguillarum M3]ARV27744.1 phage integrase family protein [Vibrio anguillarum]ASF90926.1 integrase [Vibrio anguillarum]ATA50400.1 integrase [Vibrio anguillarum]